MILKTCPRLPGKAFVNLMAYIRFVLEARLLGHQDSSERNDLTFIFRLRGWVETTPVDYSQRDLSVSRMVRVSRRENHEYQCALS